MSQSARIIQLPLAGRRNAALRQRLHEAQREAGRLWSDCVAWHQEIRADGGRWPGRSQIDAWSKGRYALHSQTVQQIGHRLLANVEATTERRRNDPSSRRWLRYPWREKRFYPLHWPAQAVKYEADKRRLVLPMGRGRKSIVLRNIQLDAIGAVSIAWNDGFELHVMTPDTVQDPDVAATGRACVDLGEIHLGTIVDDTGHAMVMSGRGIRSIKRHRSKELGKLARRQARATRGSRRWHRLRKARNRMKARARRQIRDLRHKATRGIIDFCVVHGVGTLYVGDPRGVRGRKSGRRHNQRISLWEVGRDMKYLEEKATKAGIMCFSGDERGTSSHCPECRRRRKVRGRDWRCPDCGFQGHRDLVGAVNMFPIAYREKVTFPRRSDVTYLRPGPLRRHPQAVVAPDTGASGESRCSFSYLPDGTPPARPASARSARGERELHVSDTVRHREETPRV